MEKQPILQVKNLTVKFGNLVAVDHFNMDIFPGELIGLIGPNGAGKSTAFNAITGLVTPTDGEVIFKGENVVKLLPHKRCKMGMARTFQVVRAFNYMTVEDAIRVGAYNRESEHTVKGRVDEVIEMCDLGDLRHRVCSDLGLVSLRRVELARALATRPDLLLLDETGAGLNATDLSVLMEFLLKINREQNVTLCIVEHVMQMVMGICQRLVVLDSGELIAQGTPAEISNNEKVIEAYLGKRAVPC